ncbi:MAG: adenylate/guanylate cyclase domain-containing protein [Gammaproteobacteria bacterium]|nr:adenylate/guanylate cyclase domain-containing protein [Gammaproteobacteria bacterium]
MMTFRVKLIISLVGLAIIPLIFVSLFQFNFSSNEIKKQTRAEARTIVTKIDYELQQLYRHAIFILRGISELNAIQSNLTPAPSDTLRNDIEALLDRSLSITPLFVSYQIVDSNGNQIYKSYRDKSIKIKYLQNLHDRSYFSQAMKTGKAVISEIIIARTTKKPIVILGHPILDKEGKPLGVVSGVINFQEIINITKALKVSEGAYPFITSKNGLILAHSDNDLVAKKNIFEIAGFSPEDKETIITAREGFLNYTYHPVFENPHAQPDSIPLEHFLYFLKSESDQSVIYYSIPKSDFFQTIDKIKIVIVSVVVIVSILFILIAVFVSRKIEDALEEVRLANLKTEEKNKELHALANKLAKYLSPQLYQSIFSGKKDVKLETYRKKLTVFFSDIENFSSITDSMQSESLSDLLNEYLNEMSLIAIRYGGTIDKYIGDAIMIFFGDPETKGEKEDAYNCIAMAIEMRESMNHLQGLWVSKGITTPLRIRIGVHSGYCTIGNFGSEERLDYTIVGGSVNLASRLESHANVDSILISHETYGLIKDRILCKLRGEITVKGIAYPVRTYEVIDFIAGSRDHQSYSVNNPRLRLSINIGSHDDKDKVISELNQTIARIKHS